MQAIYRKELMLYFGGMLGWTVAAILLLFSGLFTAALHLMSGYSDFSLTLLAMQWVLIVTVPFLTMRSIAQERHARTDRLLYSLPLSTWEIVLGKFFAMLTVFLLPTAVTALYPLILSGMGEVSLPSAYAALLADGQLLYFYQYDILVVSRMNHEITLSMLAYRTKLRSLLANHYMTAIRALPHHILIT